MRMSWLAGSALILFLPAAVGAATVWFPLPGSPDAGTGRHEDVWFTDALTGWVVNGGGEIWHTGDGGVSWSLQATLPVFLRSVTFTTPMHGWVGALFTFDRLWETTDGGGTWSLVPGIPPAAPPGICGMWAADENVVFAVGRYSMPAAILRTTDAGGSWDLLDVSALVSTLVDCYFPTPDLGFAVGSTGQFSDSSRAVVLRTTDGGASWDTRHTSSRPGEWGWKISFPSASVGYVSLERFGGTMTFLKTTDGGDTWTEKAAPDHDEQGIGFLTEDVGWLGGWSNPTYSTTDGGETWQEMGVMQNLNRIRFVGNGLAYAVGSRVYRYGPDPVGTPVAAATSGPTLSASAPNPFTTTASIDFTVMRTAPVRLDVFDLAGRRIRILLDGSAPPGRHHVVWNGRDAAGTPLPAGVYFWRLSTDGATETRKMQRIR